jgi:hypothetical protein
MFGSFGDQLAARIDSLPNNVPELLDQVLVRLEGDCGDSYIRDALSLLVCSRGGLLHAEGGVL